MRWGPFGYRRDHMLRLIDTFAAVQKTRRVAHWFEAPNVVMFALDNDLELYRASIIGKKAEIHRVNDAMAYGHARQMLVDLSQGSRGLGR